MEGVRELGPIRLMDIQPNNGLRFGHLERDVVIHHALGLRNIFQQNLPKPQA